MKLFLVSFFTKDIAKLFENFANQELKGKTVTFIPTASKVEKAIAEYGNVLDLRPISNAQAVLVDDEKVETVTIRHCNTMDFI